MKKSAYCKLNKYWLLLLISFFISFWFASDARAAADATLSLAITPQTVNINDTVDLVVTENPGTNANIRAVDMFIQFDPAVLRLDSIENNVTNFPSEMTNSIDNVAGSATFGTARIGGVALVGSNDVAILHFTALAVGIESAVTFEAGTAIWDSGVNVTNVGGLTGAVVNVSDPADVTGPTIAEVTPVSTPGSDTTPDYTFSSTEIGTIAYGGDCSSSTTLATSGNNTITFDALAGGAHSNCTVTLTDASSNASNVLAVTAFTIDTTAPVVTQVTPVTTPTIDTTPSYTFNTDEAGTVAYGGDCSSTTGGAISSGDNTISFATLSDGAHSNCTVTVTDAATNASNVLAVTAFTVDATAPVLAQVTPVPTPRNDTTPNYTFSSTEAGTIAYGGSCSSVTTDATTGNNTVTFDALAAGTYSNCTITVTDAATNESNVLAVTSFIIETTAPTLSEVTPITDPTTDPTPSYVFNADEAGTITYGGSCSSATTSAISGDNTITFASLGDGTYSNCTITVTDSATNASTPLAVTTFSVEATAPVLAQVTPVPTPRNDTTPNYTFSSTEAGTIAYGGSCSSVTTDATTGNNTVTFDALAAGTYSNCTITVTDAATNASNVLAVSTFIIDVAAPILAEVTPVSSPTIDTTPTYAFSSDETGVITYGGSCSSATTSAIIGTNTITFTALAEGTYSNCTITVTDSATNASATLNVTSFEVIEGAAPEILSGEPSGTLNFGTTEVDLEVVTDENADCSYDTVSGTSYYSMTNIFETGEGTTIHSFIATGLLNGSSYEYFVRCRDGNGNANTSDYLISFSVDSALVQEEEPDEGDQEIDIPKPKIELEDKKKSLTSYFRSDKKIKFSDKIEELAGGEVKLKVDGKTKDSDTINDNGDWSVYTKLDKTEKIKLYFYDENGNEVGSKKYTIKIDSEKPVIDSIPSVLRKKVGDKIWWSATDNKGVDHYKYTIYGKIRETDQDHFIVPEFVPRGPHGVTISAYDKAGNKATKHVLVWVW